MNAPSPLPVTVVSGYLGAGKTTLINTLLAADHGLRLAVLVNDFGEIAIDADLIINRTGETMALANGCICCSMGGDLYDALDRVLRSGNSDHLIIETSGVADPAKIRQIAVAEPDLQDEGIVTLVDLANLEQLLADPFLEDTVRRQLSSAKVVIMTKGDLCDPSTLARVTAIVAELTPGALRIVGYGGAVPWEMLLSGPWQMNDVTPTIHARRVASLHRHDHDHGDNDAHDHGAQEDEAPDHGAYYASWSHSGPAVIARDALEQFLGASDLGFYRVKGFVRLVSGETVEIQRAGNDWRISDGSGRFSGTRFVAIGPAAHFLPEKAQTRWAQLTVAK